MIVIIMDIFKAPTVWLKFAGQCKRDRAHMMYVETQVIGLAYNKQIMCNATWVQT